MSVETVDMMSSARGAGSHQPADGRAGGATDAAYEPGEWLRGLFGQTVVGIAETDPSGRFVRVNEEYGRIVGRPPEALRGIRMQDITHPDDLPRNLELFERALRDGSPFAIEKRYVRPDGSIVWVNNSVSIVRDGSGRPRSMVAVSVDLTSMRDAADAVRESEERYRTLLRSISEGFALKRAVVGADGRIQDFRFLEVNPAFAGQTGLSGVEGRTMREVLPDLEPGWIERFAAVVHTGRPERFQDYAASLDRWFDVFACRIGGEGSQEIAVLVSDVSERARAEQRVRESERRFRMLAENISQLVWMADEAGRIYWYNQRWFEYTGTTLDQVQGWGWTAVHHPDHVDRVVRRIQEAWESGQAWEDTFPLRGRDGVYRWFLGRALPIRDAGGRVIQWFGTCTDVDDAKRADDRLRLLWEAAALLLSANDPHAMLRSLVTQIGPALETDTYFNYVVNDTRDALSLASCAGVPDAAIPGLQHLEFGQGICGRVAAAQRAMHVRAIQASDEEGLELVKPLGIRAYVSQPLLAGGHLLGTLAFASHTKDAFEDDEVAFLETVCSYVTVAYERLRLLAQLREADRRKDEFLATLAHELRNPLAPIRTAIGVLRRSLPQDPTVERLADVMARQLGLMARLVDDLLNVSRISRGDIELRPAPTDLRPIVAQAVDAARAEFDSAGVELDVHVPADPVPLTADPARLLQVVGNLLNNALKFTAAGGRVSLRAGSEAGEAVIRVRDTGIGLAPEDLSRIFEMFVQVDSSLERSRGGLGLGLTIVRSLVELHGGRVGVSSAGLGQGAEFTVRLPLGAGAPAAIAEPDAGAARPRGRRVLVVEDNRDSAEMLAALLELNGHTVQVASDGLHAVRLVEAFHPDIVFLDIGLPGLNGYEVAERIRALQDGRRVRLVALTGWGQEADRQRATEAGFDQHFVKPIDPDLMVRLVDRVPLVTPAAGPPPDAFG